MILIYMDWLRDFWANHFDCGIAVYHIWVYHNGYAFTMNEMHDSYNGQPKQWQIISDAKMALSNLRHVGHFSQWWIP